MQEAERMSGHHSINISKVNVFLPPELGVAPIKEFSAVLPSPRLPLLYRAEQSGDKG
jgi:hypothetical protein